MFNHRLRRKFQDSSTKHQTKLSSQATKTVGTRRAHLEFGAWSLFGGWSLELGISRRNASRWHRPRTRRVAVNAVPANVRFSSGALAQLVRAPPCHGGGCGFEPRRLRICFSHTSTSNAMHVKDDDEKRRHDIGHVPFCRSNIGSYEGNGAVLRNASSQSGGSAPSPVVDSRPYVCRVAGSSRRRGYRGLWRQRPGRSARLRRAILALAYTFRSGLNPGTSSANCLAENSGSCRVCVGRAGFARLKIHRRIM